MRILLLADIHANLPALEAVLAAAAATSYDAIWCLGDVVGYGPFPNECDRLIREKAQYIISGNHDAKVVSAAKVQKILDNAKEAYKTFIFAWTHKMLAPDVVDHLKGLPEILRVNAHGRRVLLVHGSPASADEGITVHTPQERLVEMARGADADIICAGHTHDAFSREIGTTLLVNPGSVGRPFGGDGRASFSLLEITPAGIGVANHRVAYDMALVVREMEAQGFPRVLVQAFTGACSPADVVPEDVRGDLIEEALRFGERCRYEKPHALQVASLSLRIFDALHAVHGYGARQRALLQAAALLHDIGIMRGADGHHKASRDMILEDRTLPLADRERAVVALIARYHRKSLPKPGHQYFAALPDHHKVMVERLGGIVRLADGLDRTHQGLVSDITVEAGTDNVTIGLTACKDIAAELEFGKIKSDLFERAFSRHVIISVTQ